MNLLRISTVLVALSPIAGWAQSPTERLHSLFEEEWQYSLRESPTLASYLGDNRYNDRWPDVSLAAISKRNDHQSELLKRLAEFDASKLSTGDQLNLDLFRRQIEVERERWRASVQATTRVLRTA